MYGYYRQSENFSNADSISDIIIKPNPAQSYVDILFSVPENKIYQIKLFSMLGTPVLNQQILSSAKENRINLVSIKNGAYLIEIIFNGNVLKREKLVVLK